MAHNPYTRFRGSRLSLNDYLAIDRTVLANERTGLAFARTALAMVVIGGSCIKFFDAALIQALGAAFLVGAVALSVYGWRRYRRTQRFLAVALEERTGAPEHPLKEAVTAAEHAGATTTGSPPSPPPA
ncbi:MAG: DUF202 domain-containing protein [Phycisphaerales bacterium]|nr:DUF202 domain-containing protein [Phycisphaerales bacterium]